MNNLAFIQYVGCLFRTNVSVYNTETVLLDTFCPIHEFTDKVIIQKNLKELLTDFSKNSYPKLITVDDKITYASVVTSDNIFVIGPVKFSVPVNIRTKVTNYLISDEYLPSIFTCHFQEFIDGILLIHNLHHEQMLKSNDLISHHCIDIMDEYDVNRRFSKIMFNNQERGSLHNPYDEELRELDSIERGDLIQLEKCWKEDYAGMYGSLSKDMMRNIKNLCIIVVAFASRAAIRGGVHPEIAFSLCDSYIQKLEECSDSVSLPHLTHKAERHFTELVADFRQKSPNRNLLKKTPHLEKCKDYIFAHLHEKITVKEIADELHLNVNYLSSLFKKYEGQTIVQFILHEKIKLAQNFLMYSTYTYSEIATYLGFSSLSHLGTHFKNITNMTLREYRISYGIEEFTNKSH